MVYPRSLGDRLKYLFWRIATPLHPLVRDILVRAGFLTHQGRQPYLIGFVSPHLSVSLFIEKLISLGYGNHFVAWHDSEEIVSLRMTDGFKKQYHLRVFEDGAVHGHYEYTPEAHPFIHINQIGFEDKRDFFLAQFGDLIIPATAEETIAATRRYYRYWRPLTRSARLALSKRLQKI